MAVVVKNAKSGIIFGYDGLKGEWRILNLETHFLSKPFDIKVLDNGGVDIAASGSPFISDIVFNDIEHKEKLSLDYYNVPENRVNYMKLVKEIYKRDYPQRKFLIETLHLHKEKITLVDYEDSINWALSFKMRGFKDVNTKPYPKYHPMMNSYTASGLLKAIKKHNHYDHIKIKPTVHVQPKHMPIFYKSVVQTETNMCLYVEHEFTMPTEMEFKERTLTTKVKNRSKILDFFDNGSMYGTMIGISMSPQITDYMVHSDEGYYYAAVNYYNKKQGIVLLGEQNSDVMYYGNAMDNDIFIPDVLYEFQAQ